MILCVISRTVTLSLVAETGKLHCIHKEADICNTVLSRVFPRVDLLDSAYNVLLAKLSII